MGLLDDAIKEHLELKRRRGADAVEISRLESEALGPVPRSADGVPEIADTFEPPPEEPPAFGASPPVASAPDDGTAIDSPLSPAPSAYEPPPASYEPPAARTPSAYEPPPPPPGVYEPPAPPPPSAYEPPPPPPSAYEPLTPPPLYEPPPVPKREPWMTDDLDPEPTAEPPQEREPEPESTGLFSRLRGGRRAKHDRQPPPAAVEPEPYLPAAAHDAAPAAVQHEPDIVPADDEPEVEDLLEETPEFLEETPEHDRLWFEQRPPRDFNFDD